MQEVYKEMKLVRMEANESVMRYGGITHEAYFILKGSVVAKTPNAHAESFDTQRELLEFCRDHYRDIIWEKMENGLLLRDKTRDFVQDQQAPVLLGSGGIHATSQQLKPD